MKEYKASPEVVEKVRQHLLADLTKFIPTRVEWCSRRQWWGALIALSREENPLIEIEALQPSDFDVIEDDETELNVAFYHDGQWRDTYTNEPVDLISEDYCIFAEPTPRLERIRKERRKEPEQCYLTALEEARSELGGIVLVGRKGKPFSIVDRTVVHEVELERYGQVRVIIEVENPSGES